MNLRKFLVIATFFCFLTSLSAITVGEPIKTTAQINIHDAAGTASRVIATVPIGTAGTVVSGPTSANGYNWLQVTLQTISAGTVNGWCIQDYLSVIPYTSSTVYTDSLGVGWKDVPLPYMITNYMSSTQRTGIYGIQLTSSTQYARWYTQTSLGLNTSPFQSLHLSVMQTSANDRNMYVSLVDTNGKPLGFLLLSNYIAGGKLIPYRWSDVSILLADLKASAQPITGVQLEIESPDTIYLDDISFSKNSDSTFWISPAITSITPTCTPQIVDVNGSAQCTVTVTGTGNYNSAVIWSASNGTISQTGLYTAPSFPLKDPRVTIVAQSTQDSSRVGTTMVIVNTPPIPPPVVILPAGPEVFTDSLGPGWKDSPQQNMVTNYRAIDSKDGTSSLQVNSSAPYVPLYIQAISGLNTSPYQSLHLSVKTDGTKDANFYISLVDMSGKAFGYKLLSDYVTGGKLLSVWSDISIPLTDLNATNQTVGGIVIEIESPDTMYLQNIRFSASPDTTFWIRPAVTSIVVSCDKQSVKVSGTAQCTATVTGVGDFNPAITWTASSGSINESGLYRAPNFTLKDPNVTIRATNVQDSTVVGTAIVTIVP